MSAAAERGKEMADLLVESSGDALHATIVSLGFQIAGQGSLPFVKHSEMHECFSRAPCFMTQSERGKLR